MRTVHYLQLRGAALAAAQAAFQLRCCRRLCCQLRFTLLLQARHLLNVPLSGGGCPALLLARLPRQLLQQRQ